MASVKRLKILIGFLVLVGVYIFVVTQKRLGFVDLNKLMSFKKYLRSKNAAGNKENILLKIADKLEKIKTKTYVYDGHQHVIVGNKSTFKAPFSGRIRRLDDTPYGRQEILRLKRLNYERKHDFQNLPSSSPSLGFADDKREQMAATAIPTTIKSKVMSEFVNLNTL